MKQSHLSENVRVSKLCFGCEQLGGTDWDDVSVTDIELAVNRGLDLGVNFFDSADVYGLGLSEERLSAILGPRRHDLVIATKGGVSWQEPSTTKRARTSLNSSPAYLRKAVEDSLRRLRLDYLPIYYVHWPDPKTDIRFTFDFLSRLQSEGKIGLLGCSNYGPGQIAMACEVAEVSVVQLPLNMISGPLSDECSTICKNHNVKVVAYNVLASGLLTGKYDGNSVFSKDDRRSRLPLFQGDYFAKAIEIVQKAKKPAQESGLTVGQYAIKWVIEQPCVVSAITGIKNVEQIEQNVGSIL